MKKRKYFLLFYTASLIFQSCFSTTEPAKMSEIVYYNLSDDIIDKIEIKLQQERTNVIMDVITINKEIKRGDSLHFQYNTENFISSSHHTQFFTTVYFRKQEPIFNTMHREGLVTGWFSGLNNVILQLYVGNNKLILCGRHKPEFPDVNLEATKCELDSLYK